MLMNYLYANFLEEETFVTTNNITKEALSALTRACVFPAASYVYTSKGSSVSFVSSFSDDATYRFYLKGHSAWLESVVRLELTTEDHARQYFFSRYDDAKRTFYTSDLGQQLSEFAPDIKTQFDSDHANATWDHFLNGVYGVCTRDGQPETVFKKQALVLYIEQMTTKGSASSAQVKLQLLERAVAALDEVESDFAPHEVSQTSRQRCIIDVRANILAKKPA
ncbi:DUF6058 family natural product biosynthesis protein [Sulfitobacter sp.]|uniref:DUF6058 family natural product biosynthesis protein n=1 Tax=Sulfitobacter sp. TaxID=1903071 RepID=UPI0030012A75